MITDCFKIAFKNIMTSWITIWLIIFKNIDEMKLQWKRSIFINHAKTMMKILVRGTQDQNDYIGSFSNVFVKHGITTSPYEY